MVNKGDKTSAGETDDEHVIAQIICLIAISLSITL